MADETFENWSDSWAAQTHTHTYANWALGGRFIALDTDKLLFIKQHIIVVVVVLFAVVYKLKTCVCVRVCVYVNRVGAYAYIYMLTRRGVKNHDNNNSNTHNTLRVIGLVS